MQVRRFGAIDPLEQEVLFDDNRASTLEISLSSMPNIIELYKRANSKSLATFTYWVFT